ncbi:helix-turn-helix domain-containing protein [Niallia sp. XMNu-256]|uniref:PucR family transcriptional regulator n=1 Tax=Niallia sp. XMNu-256 TaxID=3082444 RepID=UPI0030CBC439
MLINHEDGHINIILKDLFNDHQEKQSFFISIIQHLSICFPDSRFYMGISKRMEPILEAPNAYKEAMIANRMSTPYKQVIHYETLGMMGTLLNKENQYEVRKAANSLLNQLECNGQINIDLVKTLYFFLVNGGNLEKTADELSLSISGLRYRIHKIEELLQKDIRNPVIGCQLLIAIQGLILLGDLEIKNILEY